MRTTSGLIAAVALTISSGAYAACGCYCVGGAVQAVCQYPSEIAPVCAPQACAGSGTLMTQAPATQPSPFMRLPTTAQHAAYCSGVLAIVIPASKPHQTPSQPANSSRPWEAYAEIHFPALISTDVLNERLRRLDNYVRQELAPFVLASSDSVIMAAIEIQSLRDRGQQEALQVATQFEGPRFAACQSRCLGASSCLVECVDAFSATAAKVLGCQLLPDGLPY